MNILYIGDSRPSSTSFHRFNALKRLGHNVEIINPFLCTSQLDNVLLSRLHYHSGYRFISIFLDKWLLNIFENKNYSQFDIVWVNGGELISPKTFSILREIGKKIILYNNDDPTGGRDGNRFNLLLKSIALYDLCVVMRNINVSEYFQIGAKRVLRVTMSYDEHYHKPLNDEELKQFNCQADIVFIGTWMRHERRDELLIKLIEAGLPLSFWGDRWEKSNYWSYLQPFYRGKSLSGKNYVSAIQGSKVCLGLLSKGNRDQHTTRTFEIPFAGGVLCAERTHEHSSFFEENKDAVFWTNSSECIDNCKKLLSDNYLRENIRNSGMRRVRELKVGNEDICNKIINYLY